MAGRTVFCAKLQKELPALEEQPWLVLGSELLRWTPGGYSERRPRFGGRAGVVTPSTSLGVLASGWSGCVPLVHPSGLSTRSRE